MSIDPPYRLDPFQNIVSVRWQALPTGGGGFSVDVVYQIVYYIDSPGHAVIGAGVTGIYISNSGFPPAWDYTGPPSFQPNNWYQFGEFGASWGGMDFASIVMTMTIAGPTFVIHLASPNHYYGDFTLDFAGAYATHNVEPPATVTAETGEGPFGNLITVHYTE